jgi:cytoskeletal protein CcmA (bactofilin family)
VVDGNISAAKLQVEPSAVFNGQCHMTGAANGNESRNGITSGSIIAMKETKEADARAAAR